MTKKNELGAKLLLDPALRKKYPELKKMTITVEEVTPEKAQEWLEFNTKNRSVRKKQVDYLTQSLVQEGGRLSTDCIAFREDKTVLNGQHRLLAIIASGVSVPCLIVYNAPDDMDEIEDHVAPRQARDLVKTKNPDIKNANDKVTIPAALWRLKDMRADSSWTMARWDNNVYTKNFLANYVVEHDKELSWALSLVHNTNADLVFSPRGTFAAAVLILAERHKTATKVFFQRLGTGENLQAGDPILTLRNYYIKQANEKAQKGTEATDPLQVRLALLFMAWNAWLEGKTWKKLPKIYKTDKKTGMTTTVQWPVPKRPSGEYKPWLSSGN